MVFDRFYWGFAPRPPWGDTVSMVVIRIADVGAIQSGDILDQRQGILRLRECQQATEFAPLRIIRVPTRELPFLETDLSRGDLSI